MYLTKSEYWWVSRSQQRENSKLLDFFVAEIFLLQFLKCLSFLLDFSWISVVFLLDFFVAETFLLQLLKCLSGNSPSDVKIFVEASFYAAKWTNKNSTVNTQEGKTTWYKC